MMRRIDVPLIMLWLLILGLGTVMVASSVASRGIEPWAGKFCIEVADSNRAFCYFVRCLDGTFLKNRSPISLGEQNEISLLKAIAGGNESVLEDLIQQQAMRSTLLAA